MTKDIIDALLLVESGMGRHNRAVGMVGHGTARHGKLALVDVDDVSVHR